MWWYIGIVIYTALSLGILFFGLYLVCTVGELRARNTALWKWRLRRRLGADIPEAAYIPAEVLSCYDPCGKLGVLLIVLGVALMAVGFTIPNMGVALIGSVTLLSVCLVWAAASARFAREASVKKTTADWNRERKAHLRDMETLTALIEETPPKSPLHGYARFWRAQHAVDNVDAEWHDIHHVHGDNLKLTDKELDWLAERGPVELRERSVLMQRQLRKLVAQIKKKAEHLAASKERAENGLVVRMPEEAWPS